MFWRLEVRKIRNVVCQLRLPAFVRFAGCRMLAGFYVGIYKTSGSITAGVRKKTPKIITAKTRKTSTESSSTVPFEKDRNLKKFRLKGKKTKTYEPSGLPKIVVRKEQIRDEKRDEYCGRARNQAATVEHTDTL
jgi:hypothetical protein